jgi:release factor glutamine methyltransferase
MVEIWTVSKCLTWMTGYFEKYRIDDAKANAELIIAHALKIPRLDLFLIKDKVIPKKELARIKDLLLERRLNKPFSYLTGEKEFYGLNFKVNPSVLIPRPETEILVAKAVEYAGRKHYSTALDLCTGSGAIAVSVAKFTELKNIYAADVDMRALETCQINSDNHGVSGKIVLKQGDMFEALQGVNISFDLILSNPPYVSEAEMAELAPELLFEPRIALYGGTDGMSFYREIAKNARNFMAPSGTLIVELSATRPDEIEKLFIDLKYKIIETVKDYSGHKRVLIALAQ